MRGVLEVGFWDPFIIQHWVPLPLHKVLELTAEVLGVFDSFNLIFLFTPP